MKSEQQGNHQLNGGLPDAADSPKRVLLMTSVTAEREAILRGLQGNPRFEVLVSGVGSVAAAVSTTRALTSGEYDLVICAGIAGGFSGQAEVGSLVVATEIVSADLGAETGDGFCSLEELGFGCSKLQMNPDSVDKITLAFQEAKLSVYQGPVLTVSTVTGTSRSAQDLAERVPGATAEAMEGYGVGFAAKEFGIPVLEIRAISNLVGPRDRSAWRIKEALELLTTASTVLKEVLP